uniref:fibronectin type III domain-containing protein 5-like n=1 Tax=Solea senegalensis TaxID=28829 RepID=UPI001CD906BC|nr:fibronectin type III domain-containing protein 5-like [Solea senegalensis]
MSCFMRLWRLGRWNNGSVEEVALHVASLCVWSGREYKTAAVRDLNITACVTQLVIIIVADSLSPPVNVTIKALKANSAVVTWDIPEGDSVIGFAITQQKKDVRMLRFIQEVNTTTRSCALWDLEEETDYIVRVQSISMSGTSPPSELLRFRTPKEAETQASKSKDTESRGNLAS